MYSLLSELGPYFEQLYIATQRILEQQEAFGRFLVSKYKIKFEP